MRLTKSKLLELIENEICNSVDEDVEITAAIVEEKCWVVIDWERETDPDLYYTFDIDNEFFKAAAEKFK